MGSGPAATAAHEDLFIYYLSGRFRPDRPVGSNHYIGCWEEENFSFLFYTRPSLTLVQETVKRLPGPELPDHYPMTYDQWQGGPIQPCRIGRFTILPPWPATGKRRTENTIILDPGVV